jgi:chromosome segregation ATPase
VSTELDEIRDILAQTAKQQAENSAAIARLESALTQTRERIEAGFSRTQELIESNARAIQTWESRINEVEEESQERDSQQAVDIQTIGRMFWSAVEQQRSDRRQWQERWEQQQQEWGQRFDNLLQEARADRQQMQEAREANEAEHRAFTQNSQVLLAEIARLWRRLAG